MKNITIPNPFTALGKLLRRFHMTIFIIFIAAGLSVAVLYLNMIINDPSNAEGYTSPIDAGSIDQTTLDRIKELHTSDEATPALTFPEGRINPFAE